MHRQKILDMIIEHNLSQKWLQDEIATAEAEQKIDNEVCRRMRDHEPEWNTGEQAVRRQKYKDLLKAVRAEVTGEVQA